MKNIKKYNHFINEKSVHSPLLDLKNNIDFGLIEIINDNFKKGSKILEISCGNGEDSLYLQRLGYSVTCTEIDDNYVNNATNKGLNCIKHDTKEPFPFTDGEFDIVYIRLGLHYFNRLELNSIFREIQRIGNSVLLTVKIKDDGFKTNKIILSPEIWNSIISEYFNIEIFNIKEGELYGEHSKWLEIFAQ